MLCEQLMTALLDALRTRPQRDILIINLGKNDLVRYSAMQLLRSLHRDIQKILDLRQGVRQVWANMLPKQVRRSAASITALDKAWRKLNQQIREGILIYQGAVIMQPRIHYGHPCLFRSDEGYLSTQGWVKNPTEGICVVLSEFGGMSRPSGAGQL